MIKVHNETTAQLLLNINFYHNRFLWSFTNGGVGDDHKMHFHTNLDIKWNTKYNKIQ